jgi:hypothetical protein
MPLTLCENMRRPAAGVRLYFDASNMPAFIAFGIGVE